MRSRIPEEEPKGADAKEARALSMVALSEHMGGIASDRAELAAYQADLDSVLAAIPFADAAAHGRMGNLRPC